MLGLMALAACNGVRGDIDGQSVPSMPTAFFVESDDYYGNDGAIQIFLSSVDLGCDGYEDMNEDLEDDANSVDIEGYVDTWTDNLPEDFWQVQISLRVDDVDDPQGSIDFDAQDWDDGLADDDEGKLWVTHYTDYPEASWPDIFDDISDIYVGDRGELAIRRHSPGERISGYFDAPMVDLDGDDEGEARVNFSASYCRGMEDFLL